MTTIIEHLKNEANAETNNYNYVGEVFGSEPMQNLSPKNVAVIILAFSQGDDDLNIVNHPTNGGRSGWYTQGDDILRVDRRGNGELVFEAVEK